MSDSGSAFLIILLIIGYICFWFWIAKNASAIAEDKGYHGHKWFHMCFWFGFVGLILVAAMPNRHLQQQQKEIIDLLKQNKDHHQPASTVVEPVRGHSFLPDQSSRKSDPIHDETPHIANDAPKVENQSREIGSMQGNSVTIDRSKTIISCPCCGTKQRSDRSLCYRCAVQFVDATGN